MSTTVSRLKAQNWLALIWFVGSALLVLLLVLQSLLGRYDDKTAEAWGWFLPVVLPTLSLVGGVLVTERIAGPLRTDRRVGKFVSHLTCGASVFYLVVTSLTLLLSPFADDPPLQVMQMSNLWLGPLQGLVCGLVGAFFVKEAASAPPGTAPTAAPTPAAPASTAQPSQDE